MTGSPDATIWLSGFSVITGATSSLLIVSVNTLVVPMKALSGDPTERTTVSGLSTSASSLTEMEIVLKLCPAAKVNGVAVIV